MSQCKTKTVTFDSILRSRAFNAGVNDARKGRPFNYDVPEADEWNYIRGRHFAQIFTGSIKSGRYVRHEALYEFVAAWNANVVI